MREAPAQACAHRRDCSRIERGLAPAVERPARLRAVLMRGPEDAAAQHRRQRHRDDAGDDDRDHDGDGEFVQQPPDDAAHEQHGNEHGGERDGHGQDGEADFARAAQRRLIGRLALLDVAHDVLQHDDGVVDDEADGQRQRHQREIVEAEAERGHAGEGADDRDGQRERGNEGRRHRAQEQEDHADDQDGRDQQRHLHVVDGGADRSGCGRA